MRRSKHSKPYRMNSRASSDKRPMDRMGMGRKVTREAYEAREIEQAVPGKAEVRKDNQKAIDSVQSGYKPMTNGRVKPGG